MMGNKASALLLSSVFAFSAVGATESMAAEQATSFYLLGSKDSMAGFIPPPGTYVADLNYYYAGSASGSPALSLTLPRTGSRDILNVPIQLNADVKVDARAYYNIPTAVWVSPQPVLGGHWGMSLAVPVGWKDVGFDLAARATITLPSPINRTIQAGTTFSGSDDQLNFGDPIVGSFIGWHSGAWHWNIGAMLNVPLGAWDRGRMANIGFNHWAFDTTAAVTWLDPKVGLELSLAAGITFNSENPDTNYKSGTDGHIEFAAMQHFSPKFALGLVGYHYQQLTGDSGSGAVLGDFKGRVTAIGPAMTYTFQAGPIPISTKLTYHHEFNEQNRLQGDVGMFTLTIPLGGPKPPPAPGMK